MPVNPRRRQLVWGAVASAALAACTTPALRDAALSPSLDRPELQPPASPREFRAAWVATVANIDWPSRPGLAPAQWRAEAIAMLDRAAAIGLNAIVLQVRPAADALYASTLEPWSEYLTGTQGLAPATSEDPLTLWVTEAHRRGLELHAWFNPYRARHSSAKSALAPGHLAQTRPEAVKRYGDMLWMDPAEPAAMTQTLAVVADVVRRYDIDGVHIDDYFYPYPVSENGAEQPFPDEPAWQRYLASGGKLDRAAWRRAQVDNLVQALYQTIHDIKPAVRFGISPFGLGKPTLRPAGIVGFSQYDKLYADVERWLASGWLDYLAPQLYWPLDRKEQSFDVLLDHWLAQNPQRRHVWPGLYTSMVGAPPDKGLTVNPKAWPAQEVLTQIDRARLRPESTGHLHFSMVALMQDRDGVATRLRTGPYAQRALAPATPWLGGVKLPAPRCQRQADGRVAVVATAPGARVWSVWRRRASAWQFDVVPASLSASGPSALLAATADDETLVVRAVDALGVEGDPAVLLPAGAR